MNISVFGTGEVGSAVASKLKSLGHDTVFGSRHPGSDRDGIPVLSHADAAGHGDWIVNAINGEDAVATLMPLDPATPPYPSSPLPPPSSLPPTLPTPTTFPTPTVLQIGPNCTFVLRRRRKDPAFAG